ncbi:MAG: nucleotide sugar dehydrogenase [Thermoanaerobaculia bacterium]
MTSISDETGTARAANDAATALHDKITTRRATVGIVGLGYVGLPLALVINEAGFPVIGFDLDPEKIRAIGEGVSYIKHIDGNRISQANATKRFRATTEFEAFRDADVIVVCVPTPLTPQREPDMRFIISSAEMIRRVLTRGQLVVLESTTYPGTTDELLRELLEQSGLKCGSDFFLAFSPEREDPGRKDFTTSTIPKVVGGVDRVSGDLAEQFYAACIARTVRVSSARTAEAAKLTENIFRAVNIALVNELKVVYDRLGIDIWEVLDAAESKPFGFMRFNPGPGWGGHCIPLDPFYLTWKAREVGVSTRFIELAGEVNIRMPEYVIEKLVEALNDRLKPLRGSRILVIGLAYKKNIDDARESPAFEILEKLLDRGAVVNYHDPFIPVAGRVRRHPEFEGLPSVALTEAAVREHDATIIITDHDAIDYALIARSAGIVIDTRGVMRRNGLASGDNVVRA